MKSRTCTGIMLLVMGIFLLYQAGMADPEGKKVLFRSAYVAPQNPHPKIGSSLQHTMQFIKTTTKAQRDDYFKKFSPDHPPMFKCDADGRIQCYVLCKDLQKSTLRKLDQYGVKIQLTDPVRRIVQTSLSEDQIYLLETLPEVRFIRLPSYPVTLVGSFTTEGYDAMHIDDFVNRPEFLGTNVTGKDIKVGVISSAINLATESSAVRDLPPDELPGVKDDGKMGGITYYSFRTDPDDPFGGDYGLKDYGIIRYWTGQLHEEGTAMSEIIHDIVPDAKLYFSNFDTDLEMNMCKDWLRDQGCDVIVDDIAFYNAGPYDGTSSVSEGSSRQVQNGAAYYTAVGNQAQEHWWGKFYDPEGNNIHNFSTADETMEVKIMPGGYLVLFLSWDEPWGSYPPYDKGSGYDIDIYILDPNLLDFDNPLAAATDLQLGLSDPVEDTAAPQNVIVNNTGNPMVVSIVLTRKKRLEPYNDVTNPMRMNLFLMGYMEIYEKDYSIKNGSILNNNDAGGGVVSVAAIDVSERSHSVVEYFSSWGPTFDGRLKPEIASFDGTRGGSALQDTNFGVFFGTSCAAPHAAAVAALIKGYKVSIGDLDFSNPWNPAQVVDNINSALFQGAEDMMPKGLDYASGYGRINAYNIFVKNFLGAPQRTKVYTFNTDTEGWQFVGIPAYFTEALHSHENGKLVLQSVDHDTFGAWESPVVTFSDGSLNLNPAKLYIARFMISTSSMPDKFPGFRLRANGMMNNIAHVRDYNSQNGQEHYPGTLGTDYYLIFRPTKTEAMSGIRLSFDLINFNVNDDISGIMYLDAVEITEYDLPGVTPASAQ